jgi:NitT/TauT family transport system substrate-binding protein
METPAVGEDSMKVFASLMVGGLVALLAGLGGVRADPLKIRVAWIVPASNIASILFAKPGIAQHLGTSYVMEPVHFQGTPPMVTALAVDDLDVAVLGYSSLDLAVQNAGMDDLRIVADEFQDGVDDYFTNLFMVRADSPIHKVEDLKGKVLATNAGGSAVDVAMRAVLHKAGLVENRDYTVVEAGFGAMKAMLGDRKVDLVPAVVPFSQDAELRKNAMGPSELGFWVARQGFLEKHRAAMLDFLEDTLRATRWYLDPANHDEAVKIAADFSKAPPALFSDWLFTKKDYYRDANLIPNLDALQANVDLQRDLGFFTGQIDVRKYTDLSLVEEAAKRLK